MFIEAPHILHVESCLYIQVLANFNVAIRLTVIVPRKFMSSTFLEVSGGINLLSDIQVNSRTVSLNQNISVLI